MGFQATATYGLTEGHGVSGSGRAGDARGDLRAFRLALDDGRYRRIGELTPESAAALQAESLGADSFTIGEIQARYRRERAARQQNSGPIVDQ